MNQRVFLGLTMAATISAIAIPTLVQAQTRIGDLQRSHGTTGSGQVVSVVDNNFILEDDTW